MIKTLFILIFTIIGTLFSLGQTNSKIDFTSAEAIYTKLSCDINIQLNDGKLTANSSYSEDLKWLTDNSVKQMSHGRIYHSQFYKLINWQAYTQLDRKKMKVANETTTSSPEDYVFYDDSKTTSFDFTGGEVGATRHLEYETEITDAHLLNPFYFDRYFPVIKGELRIVFPSEIKLNYVLKGLNSDKVKMTESKKKDKTIWTFTTDSLAASQPYNDAPNSSYYATHVIFYVTQVKLNNEWTNFLSSVDDLYRYSHAFIKDVNTSLNDETKMIADSLTRNCDQPLQKAKAIYAWVQSNIKYIAFEEGLEGFVPRDANVICKRRFGDCKDMTSILTAMLNHVGVPAYFTWIGTVDIPYDYTEVPLPIVDNHMICTIRNGDQYIFLDGTDQGGIFGTPASHIQGKQALVSINDSVYKLIRVPISPKQTNLSIDTTFLHFTEKGDLSGNLKIKLSGYYSSSLGIILGSRNENERKEFLDQRFSRGNNKIKFSNWKFEQTPDHSEMTITADLTLPDYAKKLGDEFFVNLNLFKFYEHEEIDYPKRKMPIQFNFLKHSSYVVALTMPDGYQASYLPDNESYNNDVWGFVMKYATSKQNVYLTQEFDTDQLLLTADKFQQWNKVLEHLFPHYKQTIVIGKL